jgi:4-hydroxybenzoate polyprenyltransferase
MHPQLRAWAQLVRVPNTLTACADVFAGFTLATGAWWHIEGIWQSLLVASLASICLYWAGMVLNDVHDVAEDTAQRRNGPLVRGSISVQRASRAGWVLLLAGVGLAGASAYCLPATDVPAPYWIVTVTGAALAASIVAYDSSLKGTFAGPFLMGLCRGLNLLMGVALGACVNWPFELDWSSIGLATMGHVGFVTGITLAARREGLLQQSSVRLAMSWSVSVLGVAAIAMSSMWSTARVLLLESHTWFPLFVSMLAMPWLRRAVVSIQSPGAGTLVPAIKQAILSIIFLDAAIAVQFGGYVPGILVCSLAIPTFAMSRIFRVT